MKTYILNDKKWNNKINFEVGKEYYIKFKPEDIGFKEITSYINIEDVIENLTKFKNIKIFECDIGDDYDVSSYEPNKCKSNYIKILNCVDLNKHKDIIKLDSNNNCIYLKKKNEEWHYEYNDNNKLIYSKTYKGEEWFYRYNDNNILTYIKTIDSNNKQREYFYIPDDNNSILYKEKYKNKEIYHPFLDIRKYDKNNNLIYQKSLEGDIWKFRYNKNNNLIFEQFPSGDQRMYRYDKSNNLIFEKSNNLNRPDFEAKYKYDENNNCIYYKNVPYKYEYNVIIK